LHINQLVSNFKKTERLYILLYTDCDVRLKRSGISSVNEESHKGK